MRFLFKYAMCLFIVATCCATASAARPEPTFRDVHYGSHERSVLDFWKAESDKPTPLVIFIHGGGFSQGSKGDVSGSDIEKCLKNGVSIASISYPYYQDVELLGIIRDNIARSVQFLRYKAGEWNIDKSKVAVYGDSAGAGASLWLAVHDDLADPGNADAVLRESTRVVAAGALSTQATYDFMQWFDLFANDFDKGTLKGWRLFMMRMVLDMYHLRSEKQLNSEKAVAMRHELDMLSMMDAADAPVYMRTFYSQLNQGDLLHHWRHPVTVKERCDAMGMKCVLELDETPQGQRIDVIDFLLKYLK